MRYAECIGSHSSIQLIFNFRAGSPVRGIKPGDVLVMLDSGRARFAHVDAVAGRLVYASRWTRGRLVECDQAWTLSAVRDHWRVVRDESELPQRLAKRLGLLVDAREDF